MLCKWSLLQIPKRYLLTIRWGVYLSLMSSDLAIITAMLLGGDTGPAPSITDRGITVFANS